MISAMQSALDGMQAAGTQIDTTAARIANYPFAMPPANSGDALDLSTDMVNLLQASDNFAADTKTAQVADQMQQSTISMLA
jgi:flagellar hook protein FlgE